MNLGWRPTDEAPYLAWGERTVVATRLHPIFPVIPFVKLAVFTYLALLAMGLLGALGTLAVLAILVQWTRVRSKIGVLLSFGWTAATYAALLLLLGLLDDLELVVYLVILIGLFASVYKLIEYFFTTIYLTDRRIFRVSGVLTRIVATMPLRALTDIRYDQTVPGRILDYGHFFVESAGQNQALTEVRFVGAPQRFYRIIMSEALGADLPPEFLTEI